MKSMISTILRQYGTGMTIHCCADNSWTGLKGFFQPVRSKNWQNAAYMATPLGEVSRGQYVFIGPADLRVFEGDSLQVGNRHYYFRRVEPYYYGEEQVYTWGLCVEKGENDTWGSQS